jgi:hypothetical protein
MALLLVLNLSTHWNNTAARESLDAYYPYHAYLSYVVPAHIHARLI